MKDLFETYYLYCTNLRCTISIYKKTGEVSVPLTEESLSTVHLCGCCHKPLVSAIDLEIELMLSSVGVKPANKISCDNNY